MFDFPLPLQSHHAKFCEQLQLNSVSVSIADPASLDLGVTNVSWLTCFRRRPFEEAVELYQELTDVEYLKGNKIGQQSSEFRAHFGGVTSDLASLPLTISPLERLQLLTSAFRKVMASLSEMKLQPMLESGRLGERAAGIPFSLKVK